MTGTTLTPWNAVVSLRDDLRSGDLSLAIFAADLYAVVMGTARPVYQDPKEFFTLTYPAYNLRELAKEVILRLDGRTDRAVRQLELTYGGGKTHALITLYHLARDPESLPDLPAVREFVQHAGRKPPRARIGVLAFDKLDVEKGMEVVSPQGERRWLRHPWSVLAYQIAGADGLRLLHADDLAEERDSPPAENLLRELLVAPAKEGLGTLILIDEVLMYARVKVDLDEAWLGRLASFFQYLTQAATAVDRCAIVASLLATDPRKSDTLGKKITSELAAIFRREKEEGIQPVLKQDVAEILRRRFFTPESIKDRELFRPVVAAALQGIRGLDDLTQKQGAEADDRYLDSYPFHPDLTDVFYTKWTNLEGFQRTRGILRTFALALRDAEPWDTCPLVGANVFLSKPGGKGGAETGLSEGARELTGVAGTEEYEGKRQDWTGILEGELGKARDIQADTPALRHREVEQAVFGTFLHSQPVGQKALTRELMALLGQTRPDRIELEKALGRWAEASWFLDEASLADLSRGVEGAKVLPKTWRLGSRPNLTQMHQAAMARIPAELVEARLTEDIGRAKSLTAGASGAGARVHPLPDNPKDIADDGEFHYAVLGPKAACEPGHPGAEACRFLEVTTGPQKPRVCKNAIVLAVPSPEGLEVARSRIRAYLGWEDVDAELKEQKIEDPIHWALLRARRDEAQKAVPEAIRQAYCIVVTLGKDGRPEAFKVTVGDEALFAVIKADPRSRIQETPVAEDALLPGGPYDLWQEGETARRVKDLTSAFAQVPKLPKMLKPQAIIETLLAGCQSGIFVMRYTRPDRSARTFWRVRPDEVALKDPGLEVVLPKAAILTELDPGLLVPGVLPGLWPSGANVAAAAGPSPTGPSEGVRRLSITVGDLLQYFAGGRTVEVSRGTYSETLPVPKAEGHVVELAVRAAVTLGKLWLTAAGGASILEEEIPAGILSEAAALSAPPDPILATDILPDRLPAAWPNPKGPTSALAILSAGSARAGEPLPWVTVRKAIDGGIKVQLLELATGSAPWPAEIASAKDVRILVKQGLFPQTLSSPQTSSWPMVAGSSWPMVAEAELSGAEIQNLGDQIPGLSKEAGHLITYRLRVEMGETTDETIQRVRELLAKVAEKLKLGRMG